MDGRRHGIHDDAPGVFDAPGVSADSDVPDVPETTDVPDTMDAPDVPGVLRMVSLTLLADEGYLPLARASAMHVGAILAFPLARVADLRLAVDEACISFLDGATHNDPDLLHAPYTPPGKLELSYDRHNTSLHIVLRGVAPVAWPDRDELGWAMLEALVSEVRAEVRDGMGVLTLIEPLPTGH